MVGVVLVAHGSLAKELLNSAGMIMGEDIPQCRAITLDIGEDLESYGKKFLEAVHEVDSGDGVLVLADLFAGTPANVSVQNLKQERYGLITGANLAMVIEALSGRDGADMAELKEMALSAAKVSMADINEKLNVKERE